MTNHQLLDMIGDARGDYLLEAQHHREAQPRVRHWNRKRLWLIAAIVALMLLLVGCAVYVFGFRDIVIGADEWTPVAAKGETTASVQTRNVISLQGYAGTPGYLAMKEWYEFTQSYEMPEDEAEIPVEERLDYLSYGCFFQEEIDKVDEICEKYGLNKLGIAWIEETPELMFEALGIHGLLLPDANADVYYYQGYYYWNGTFNDNFDLTLTGVDTPWPYKLEISMRYVKKTSFDGVNGYMESLDSYEEWNYTTKQGIEVLLALSSDDARMIVDQKDAFLTVQLGNIRAGDMELGEQKLTREGLEAVAEVINLKVTPGTVDVEAAQARYEALEERLEKERAEREQALESYGYRERIVELAEGGYDPISAVYALMDIDGNGTEELLLGEKDYFYSVCSLDGTRSKSVVWWINNTQIHICDGGILLLVDDDNNLEDDSGKIYRFAKLNGTEIEYLDWVKSEPYDEAHPWKRVYRKNDDGSLSSQFFPEDQNLVTEPISKAEFEKVLSSYHTIEIETTPIREYLKTIGHPFIQDSLADYAAYRLEQSEVPETLYYVLQDLNGDGEPELLLGSDSSSFTEVVTLVDGMIDFILPDRGYTLYLCEGGILEELYATDTYQSSTFYRVEGHTAVEIETLCYDAFSNPENPWYRYHSPFGKASYEEWLSKEEYDTALSAYQRIELEVMSLAEYPLN